MTHDIFTYLPYLAYLLTGIFSSFLSGLLGIGGGLVIVPALLFIFVQYHVTDTDHLMHVVIATSLASAIVNLAFSVKSHYQQGNIRWSVFRMMSPGVFVGALFLGPLVMFLLSGSTLKIIFGVACFLLSTQMFFSRENKNTPENLPGTFVLSCLGVFTGVLSTLLGIAGGVMIGTALNYYHMNMHKVIGTTAAIAIVLSIAGSVGLMVVGYQQIGLPTWSTGFVYWPAMLCVALPSPFFAPLGSKAAQYLPVSVLKKMFAILVFMVGLKML